MSFRTVYAVCDAWGAALWRGGLEWRLAMHLARQTDDKTLTVIRSSARLGAELGVSDRHVRTYLKYWRERGVLRTVEHGGGTDRKPAKYQFDLGALKVVAMREAERVTAERKEFRSGDTETPCGSPCTSAETMISTEPHEVPQSTDGATTSGVIEPLRNSDDATAEVSAANCGSAAVPTLQRVIDSKNSEEVGTVQADATSQANSLATATRALASSPTRRAARPSEAAIKDGVEKLSGLGYDENGILRLLKQQSVTIADVRRYTPYARGARS